jgi:hypothetical protein
MLINNPAASATTFSHKLNLLVRYEDEFAFAMRPDWWPGGSVALSAAVIDLAEQLIENYGTVENLTEVAPGRDGSLSFVWDDHAGNYIYLDVGPNDTVHLYRDTVADGKWQAVSVAGDRRIRQEIERSFRGAGWPLARMVAFRIETRTASRPSIRLAAV